MQKSIFSKIFWGLIALGILPMTVFSFLTISSYQNLLDKYAPYIREHPELISATQLSYKNIQIQTVLIFVLITVFIFFFSVILARRFIFPIKKLIQGTEKLRQGNLNTKIKISTQDEFEDLADSFNEMTKDLKKSRSAIEQERNKVNSIIENFKDPIIFIDKKNRIKLFNYTAQKILGFTSSDLGKKVDDKNNFSFDNFLPLIKDDCKILELKEIESVAKIKTEELSLQRKKEKNKRTYKIITTSVRDKNKNNYYGMIKVFYDLTREKHLDELKSEFISVAAHQLRTPLSAIKWAIQMAISEEEGGLSEEQQELLNKAYKSNERVINLVRDLLNVSRIEEGRFGYEFSKVNFKKVFEVLMEEADNQIKKKKIKLQIQKPKKLPVINADKEKIILAVQNLLDNAIKYTPERGEVYFGIKTGKKELEITVKDNGVGIPEKDQKKLFSKFFRGENVMRMQTEGTGLGLFIAKNIIENHNGRINIDSEEGKGTETKVFLPLKKK